MGGERTSRVLGPVGWIWMAVGAVVGSILADAWCIDRWSAAGRGLLVALGASAVIWIGVSGAKRLPVVRRLAAAVRGGALVIVWAVIWQALFASLPASNSTLGALSRGGQETAVVDARVVSVPEPRRRGWVVQIVPIRFDGATVDSDGWRLRVFLPRPPGGGHQSTDRAPAPLPLPGDQMEAFIRMDGYPRKAFPHRADPRRLMRHRGVAGRGIIDGEVETTPPRGVDWWVWLPTRLPAWWRTAAVDRMVEQMGAANAAYPAAMVLGARGLLDQERRAGFEVTGMTHLLAISGLHLGVLGGGLWWLVGMAVNRSLWLLRRWGRRRVCGLVVLSVLGLYVIGIGAPTSAVRAWWMVACGVVAMIALRPTEPLRLLAAAVFAMLAANPFSAGGIGFQLSVGATAAILLWVARLPGWLERPSRGSSGWGWNRGDGEASWFEFVSEHRDEWLRKMGIGIGVSVMATVVTWPILVSMTGELPTSGLVMNVMFTPVASATIIPWMFVAAGVTACVGEPGWWMLQVGADVMSGLGWLLRGVSAMPGTSWVLGVPAGAWTVVGVVGALLVASSRLQLRPLGVGLAMLAVGLLVEPTIRLSAQRLGLAPMSVHLLPVGQGDSTLVVAPGGETVLIDAGGSHFGRDPGRAVVVPYLKRLGIGRVDWVVASHADTDHIGGLSAVVEEMTPETALYDADDTSENMVDWLEVVAAEGVVREAVTGVREYEVGRVELRVMRPDPLGGSANDRSLYVEVGFGGERVVLPGDIEARAERWLARRGLLRPAVVAKVPHHGSKTSTSRAFLEGIQPAAAVVSAGADNPFGHPHARVIRRLAAADVEVFQTATHGLVKVDIHRSGDVEVRTTRRPRR